jgi:hypothetical protein
MPQRVVGHAKAAARDTMQPYYRLFTTTNRNDFAAAWATTTAHDNGMKARLSATPKLSTYSVDKIVHKL